MAGQINWFFSIILIGFIFFMIKIIKSKKIKIDIKFLSILYWFLWLIPYLFFLSFIQGIFHRHYIVVLAPPIAALCGIFSIKLWDSYKGEEKIGFLFPVAIFLTGFFHFYIVKFFKNLPMQSGLIILLITSIISILLILKKLSVVIFKRIPNIFLYIPVIIILSISPLYWSFTPLIYGGNFALPYASPELDRDTTKGNRFISKKGIFEPDIKIMYDFLVKNNESEEFLIATPSTYAYAVSLILYHENKKKPVMTIGGFTGRDPILSLDSLKDFIDKGKVRFFLVPTLLGVQDQKGNAQLYHWLIEHGKKVDKKLWFNNFITRLISEPLELYDLKQ